MDYRHAGVQHNESTLDVDAERGGRVPATLDTDLVQFGGKAFCGLRAGTCYKDRPASLLVGTRDTLQCRALPGPCLTNDDNEPLIGTRDSDCSLLLTRKLTAALRNPSREKFHLGAHERLIDHLSANVRELADAPQGLALERAMHRRGLPAVS
jgi:hypothetical protein